AFVTTFPGTLRFGGGTHNLGATSGITGTGSMLLALGTVNLSGTYNVTSTNITSGRFTFQPAGRGVMRTKALNFGGSTNAWVGRLDLTDDSMIIDYDLFSPVAQVRNQLHQGHSNGWTGDGIVSSSAAADHTKAIGYLDTATNPRSIFAGQSVDSTSVLLGYTYFGDADLDGDADGVDIGTWATNFTGELGGTGTMVWTQGDWDYDGDVDGVDAGLWAQAFTGELGGGGLGNLVVDNPNIAPGAAAILRGMGIAVVPEPALLAPFGLALATYSLRSRKHRRERMESNPPPRRWFIYRRAAVFESSVIVWAGQPQLSAVD
ncbi:MAG TPA: hypothetical protein VH518_24045, partial [Tepidisphaeraceae bacterium]